jgi:hypothetical protein
MTETPARLVRRGALPDMVRWYSPTLLAQIAVRTAISSTFGQYADQRLLQAVTDSASEAGLRVRYDFSDLQTPDPAYRLPTDSQGGIWVDYVADVGDGFLATYATAYHLAQPALDVPNAGKLPAGDILIMGGDQAYPAATRETYKDRFQLPFRWAFPATTAQRRMFAIPGNHDWYDGLAAFDSLFCAARAGDAKGGSRIGGWQCQQHRSYWSIRLPYDWWIWGADIQFSQYLDEAQIRYFELMAESMQPGHKVVICMAEPAWLEAERKIDVHGNLAVISTIARKRGAEICAVIAGDWHHYSHYTSQEIDTHFIVAGGGGAFMHATHDLRTDVDVTWLKPREAAGKNSPNAPISLMATMQDVLEDDGSDWVAGTITISLKETRKQPRLKPRPVPPNWSNPADIAEAAGKLAQETVQEMETAVHKLTGRPRCYPDRWRSRMLSLRNLAFPFKNWSYCLSIGLIYWVITWLFHIVVTDARIGGAAFDRIGAGKGWAGFLEHLSVVPAYIVEVMSYSIGFSLMLACLLAALITYVHVDETRTKSSRWTRKFVVGFLHFLAHLTIMMVLMVALIRWHQMIAPVIQTLVDATWELFSYFSPNFKQRIQAPIAPIEQGRGWVPHVLGFIYPLEMAVVGGLIGGFVWGLYWVLANVIMRMHCGDAFAALRIKDYRNFLRMRFEPDRLTIYPIGIDRVPGARGWQDAPPAAPGTWGPLLVPRRPITLKLIEDPIVIVSRQQT